MNKQLLDLYTDYIISSFSYTTATGLSRLVDNDVSHDKITRFLSEEEMTSADLWQIAKAVVREIQQSDGVLIIDDTIEQKPYTDENEIVTWHYDHTKGHAVKGIQIISVIYNVNDITIPVAFATVKKTENFINEKTGKVQKKSAITKNDQYRDLLKICVRNEIPFKYILNDVWYGSAENMMHIKHDLKKHFIMPIKSNRKIALNISAKRNGSYVSVDSLVLKSGCTKVIYLESVDFPLLLIKQIFKNEDGSSGILYLVSNDLTLCFDQMKTIYQKRWKVEEYHKSLKSNLALTKSPTKTEVTQTNHLFASLAAFIKMETLKMKTSLNHFALKSKIYFKSLQAAYKELKNLSPKKFGFA